MVTELREELMEAIATSSQHLHQEWTAMTNDMETHLTEGVQHRLQEVEGKFGKMDDRLDKLEEETAILRRAVARGEGGHATEKAVRLDFPRPKAYAGERNAREVDDFIWGMEQYLENSGIATERAKVRVAAMSLIGPALLWWRRREADKERSLSALETWDQFKTELTKQFSPANVLYEARARLRKLQHRSTIKEYVSEFQEILLDIPNSTEEETLFTFLDGLQPWARTELERRGVSDLSSAIAAAEKLVELRRNPDRRERDREKGKMVPETGGNPDQRPRRPWEKGRGFRHSMCLFCNGNHGMRDCPSRGKIASLLKVDSGKEEGEEEVDPLGCVRFVGTAQTIASATPTNKRKGVLFATLNLLHRQCPALVDSGAEDNIMGEEVARRLQLQLASVGGKIKGINGEPVELRGRVTVAVKIGEWQAKVAFMVAPLDDFGIILGLTWLD